MSNTLRFIIQKEYSTSSYTNCNIRISFLLLNFLNCLEVHFCFLKRAPEITWKRYDFCLVEDVKLRIILQKSSNTDLVLVVFVCLSTESTSKLKQSQLVTRRSKVQWWLKFSRVKPCSLIWDQNSRNKGKKKERKKEICIIRVVA